MLAAGADPKPEALGAFGTQALPVETAKPQSNLQFYMQISESPITGCQCVPSAPRIAKA
jgi:hypothetical protein